MICIHPSDCVANLLTVKPQSTPINVWIPILRIHPVVEICLAFQLHLMSAKGASSRRSSIRAFTTHSKRKSGQRLLSPNLTSGSYKSARNEVGLSGVYQVQVVEMCGHCFDV